MAASMKNALGNTMDLTGRVYGMLTVVRFAGKDAHGKARWDCICECGEEALGKSGADLKRGDTTSCGCYRRDAARKHATSHGMSHTPEWNIWIGMRDRCSNPNAEKWHRYGGRGIFVCDEWSTSFENFFADMGPRPSNKHSVERIDNDGPYAPWNCVWSTPKNQANNTSRTKFLTYLGVTKPLAVWCEELCLNYKTVRARLDRGWSTEDALSVPRIDNKDQCGRKPMLPILKERARAMCLSQSSTF